MARENLSKEAQWLCGRVLDSVPRSRGFEPHRLHYVVSLSMNINPSLVLVQPRKTRPYITERLLMGSKESNQTNKNKHMDCGVRKSVIGISDKGRLNQSPQLQELTRKLKFHLWQV